MNKQLGTARKLQLIRDVTPDECDWLSRTYKKDEILTRCFKPAYGCILSNGVGLTENEDGDYPFFEIPWDAVKPV